MLHSKQTNRLSLPLKTKIPEKLVPRKYTCTSKVPDTKGCERCCVGRNPYNGYKYLCGALPNGVILMQWYEPLNKFMQLKVSFEIGSGFEMKSTLWALPPCRDSDQLGHPPCLFRTFTNYHKVPQLPIESTAKTDQSRWMPRMI